MGIILVSRSGVTPQLLSLFVVLGLWVDCRPLRVGCRLSNVALGSTSQDLIRLLAVQQLLFLLLGLDRPGRLPIPLGRLSSLLTLPWVRHPKFRLIFYS